MSVLSKKDTVITGCFFNLFSLMDTSNRPRSADMEINWGNKGTASLNGVLASVFK